MLCQAAVKELIIMLCSETGREREREGEGGGGIRPKKYWPCKVVHTSMIFELLLSKSNINAVKHTTEEK
jgi:hypothetical protein